LYIFFDDYYENENSPIDIGYRHNKTPDTKQPDMILQESTNGNKVVVEVYEVSNQSDRRNIVSLWSKHQIDKGHVIQLITVLHQHIDTLDKLIGEENASEADKSSFFWAKEHYEKRTQMAFPWIPETTWTLKRNEMHDIGREYTRQKSSQSKEN
jgi:hypothetical protein